jgi:hypothetical protein
MRARSAKSRATSDWGSVPAEHGGDGADSIVVSVAAAVLDGEVTVVAEELVSVVEESATDMVAELGGPACPPCDPHPEAKTIVAKVAHTHTTISKRLKARMGHPHSRFRAERAVRVEGSGRGRNAPRTLDGGCRRPRLSGRTCAYPPGVQPRAERPDRTPRPRRGERRRQA